MTEEEDLLDDFNYAMAFEEAKASAESRGFEVVMGTPRTLLVDLDTGAQKDQFRRMFPVLRSVFLAEEHARWASKSGHGEHVVISLHEDLDVPARLALQAALGSDPKREMLGLNLYRKGIENPIMLFKPSCAASTD